MRIADIWRPRRRVARYVGGACLAILLTAVATAELLPRHARGVDNVSRNFRACLLTATADTTDAQTTQAVWAGLQQVAAAGHVNAERQPMTITDPARTLPYFNGLVQQRCDVIVSVGSAMAPAVQAAAAANGHQRFLIVGATSANHNVTSLPTLTPDATKARITALITAMAQG